MSIKAKAFKITIYRLSIHLICTLLSIIKNTNDICRSFRRVCFANPSPLLTQGKLVPLREMKPNYSNKVASSYTSLKAHILFLNTNSKQSCLRNSYLKINAAHSIFKLVAPIDCLKKQKEKEETHRSLLSILNISEFILIQF